SIVQELFLDNTLSLYLGLRIMVTSSTPTRGQCIRDHERNAARGYENTDPNRALQQGAVKLTPEVAAWLTERFDLAVEKHGKITREELDDLDWPA
ncbi:MAG TPA: hypothetical protein VIX91_22140, partial [Candidatus Acidoferrum sp.]